MLISGIDEAGYGPTLGPLAVVAVAAETDDQAALFAELAAYGVKDSKRIHKPGTLRPLEAVALPAARWWSGQQISTAAEMFACLGEDSQRSDLPWVSAAASLPLPVAATPCTWTLPAQPRLLGGHLVHPAAFNATITRGLNKSDLEWELVADLLARLHPLGAQTTTVDRLGGRAFYRDLLTTLWPSDTIKTEREDTTVGRYLCGDHLVQFCVGGETVSPLTAVASCLAKYARELHMILFNRWWCQQVPGLAPTAGYPQDAVRWLDAIGDQDVQWRGRLVRLR